ncbi:MAG: hypothetical protein ACI4DP_10465 [Candidatus Ornithomonoglobus sp.]
MKKKLSLVAALTLTASMFSAVAASAATPNAYYNGVRTFINNNPIQSYTINNHTVVSTSDIKDYGFRVVWDENARAVYISKDAAKDAWHPERHSGAVVNYKAYAGDVAFTTVPSDIKVYVNAQLVDSYNTGVLTYINLADLVKASCTHSTISKQWFADEQQSFLWISSEPVAEKTAIPLAHLTAPKAYEIAVKTLDSSIYRRADEVFKKTARVVPLPFVYGLSDNDFIDADGGYTFAVDFGSTAVNASIHVNQDGSAYFVNIPEWLTYMCD